MGLIKIISDENFNLEGQKFNNPRIRYGARGIVIRDDGKIAIMDYKAWDVPNGPPTKMRSSPEDLEELFCKHGLKKIYLNEEIGEDIPEGKSHYLIMFEKN